MGDVGDIGISEFDEAGPAAAVCAALAGVAWGGRVNLRVALLGVGS